MVVQGHDVSGGRSFPTFIFGFSNFTQIGVHPFPRLGDGGSGIGSGGGVLVVGYGGDGGGDGILLITLVDLVQ